MKCDRCGTSCWFTVTLGRNTYCRPCLADMVSQWTCIPRLTSERDGLRAEVRRFEDALKMGFRREDDLKARAEAAEAKAKRLMAALVPFAHPDLCKLTGGTAQGADSPLYARDKATLFIRDFRLAASLTAELKGGS